MSIGLGSKLNILEQSPHDLNPKGCTTAKSAEVEPGATHWVPSRYTVRAVTGDGRLVLWNTYRGTMSVFKPEQRSTIEGLLVRKGFEARPKGVVKYLSDRGFVLAEGTDEMQRVRMAFGQSQYRTNTLQFCLLASEDCNFRCHYCYEKFARGTMEPWVREGIKSLVRRRLSGLKSLSIEWFGGEPLYGFQAIEDLAPFFIETAREHSLGFHSGMTTNGFLLTPETAEKLLAWEIRRFQITIDGPPEMHDCSRPTRDGQGTFDTIFANLKSMQTREDDFEIDLRVNWDKSNYPHLDRFLDLVEREFKGDSRFKLRFHSVFAAGGPNDDDLQLCGLDESLELQAELEREARNRGLSIADDLRDVKQIFGSKVCYAARPYHFVIGASGKIMKCTIELDTSDRNIVGQLTEEGDLQLDHDKMAMWCEPAFESDSKCQKCVVLPMCLGSSCPLIRFRDHRSPCIPLRTNFKKELKSMVEASDGQGRQVTVGCGCKEPSQMAAT